MKKRTITIIPVIIVLTMLLMVVPTILTSCGGTTDKTTTSGQSTATVDVCKCLTEPGDSPYMIGNRDACRDAISQELGVENWEKVNMSQNIEVSRKFDALAARCTTSTKGSSNSESKVEKHDCVGNQNCITDVRRLVNGAGYEIADEKYDGEGVFYIAAYKYGPGEPINITYVMDCNCAPVDIKIGNTARTNSSSEKLHRCGRAWDGSLYEGGAYGDYCGLECYADNYPN